MTQRRSLPKSLGGLAVVLDERFDSLDQKSNELTIGQNLLLGQTSKLEARMRDLESRERERNSQIATLTAWRNEQDILIAKEELQLTNRVEAIEVEHRNKMLVDSVNRRWWALIGAGAGAVVTGIAAIATRFLLGLGG
jgi:hypothetical protein